MGRGARIWTITAGVLLGVVSGLLAPAVSSAVRITQHQIPKLTSEEVVLPATTIFNGPQGLLIAGARKSAYQTVTTAPAFAVNAGAGAGTVASFFLGPDGQTWLVSNVSELSPATHESTTYTTIDEVTPGGSAVRFKYSTSGSTPRFAVTGPDGALWATETSEGTVDRVANATVTSYPMPFGDSGPLRIASAGGDLWTTNLVDGAIAQIAPDGTVTEHRLPGGGFGSFGNAEPYGIIVGPDGAAWFTEQNAGVIGRITTSGELQTFPIPAAAGTFPGSFGYPQPRNLAIGPEGGIWFTDPGTNSIGRVLAGQVNEFSIGSESMVPDSIATVGGELWFNEEATAALGSVNPTAPPAEEVKAAPTVTSAEVARMLSISGKAATSPTLLKHGGYLTTIKLPASGVVTISWSTRKHVTVATGRKALSAAGAGKLKIKLTAAGKKLLKKNKTLKVTARGTATLTGASGVTAAKSLTIKR